MVRQPDRAAVDSGPVGSFWFKPNIIEGVRWLVLKLPSGHVTEIPVGQAKPVEGPSWQWDGNEDKPTLSPSLWHWKNTGRPEEWHGWIRSGRMVSV